MNPQLPPQIQEKVHLWLKAPIEEEIKQEIKVLLKTDPGKLITSFSSDLSFGTSGLRALTGVGSNRINPVTIRLATEGFVQYFLRIYPVNKRVLITYDTRKDSFSLAKEAAQICAFHGIGVLLTEEPRPVPYLSFAIRHLKLGAGIMITASHNPKEYNGYKVYWSDGGEITPKIESAIDAEMKKLPIIEKKTLGSSYFYVDLLPLDEAYLNMVEGLLHPDIVDKKSRGLLHIVYSSLHGVGITLMPKALKRSGFTQVSYIEKQCTLDNDFSTLRYPNPEHRETLKMGIEALLDAKADIFICNDTDANRVGLVCMHKGNPYICNGNEIASLCAYYLCTVSPLPLKGVFITTIVTTELLKKIALSFHLSYEEVHVGFKFIAEKMEHYQNGSFIFAAEESYGCLFSTDVRDKDGIATGVLLCEIALFLKLQKKTCVDYLYEIYKTYGVFKELQYSLSFPQTAEGCKTILDIMQTLRKKPPCSLAKSLLEYYEDYELGLRVYVKEKKQESISLPKANVLIYRLENGEKVVIRPSGTEPKLRIHIAVHIKDFPTVEEGIEKAQDRIHLIQMDIISLLDND